MEVFVFWRSAPGSSHEIDISKHEYEFVQCYYFIINVGQNYGCKQDALNHVNMATVRTHFSIL